MLHVLYILQRELNSLCILGQNNHEITCFKLFSPLSQSPFNLDAPSRRGLWHPSGKSMKTNFKDNAKLGTGDRSPAHELEGRKIENYKFDMRKLAFYPNSHVLF